MSNHSQLVVQTTPLYIFNRVLLYGLLIFLTILCFTPFYMMIINATRTSAEISTGFSLNFGSAEALGTNYSAMQQNINIWRGLFNSFAITIPFTIISGYFSALTAWGLTFYQIKGRNLLFLIVIITMMIPPQLGLIGYHDLMVFLGNFFYNISGGTLDIAFKNSWLSLWFPAFFNGASVFFLRQYMTTAIPYEIIESCRMDGAGELKTFHRIGLPMVIPSLATMSIFTFVFTWNNYITPLILLDSKELFPLSLLISTLRGTAYGTNLGAIYLAIAISIIPILIAFVFLSRYIISGISAGAVKG